MCSDDISSVCFTDTGCTVSAFSSSSIARDLCSEGGWAGEGRETSGSGSNLACDWREGSGCSTTISRSEVALRSFFLEGEVKLFLLCEPESYPLIAAWPLAKTTDFSSRGGRAVARLPRLRPGSVFLTRITRYFSSLFYTNCASRLPTWGTDPQFSNKRLAKAWFSRSMRSFSLLRTDMLRERGPGCWLIEPLFLTTELIAVGPLTEERFPWEMSTNLLRSI